MNFTSGICSFKRLFSTWIQTLRNYNIVHSSQRNYPKFRLFASTSSTVTGYFVGAGCCFSRQKDTLLQPDTTCDKSVSTVVVEAEIAKFEHYSCENLLNMKRNTDDIDQPVSSNPENDSHTCDVLVPQCKKIKTENQSFANEVDSNEKTSLIKKNINDNSIPLCAPKKKRKYEKKCDTHTSKQENEVTESKRTTHKEQKDKPVKQRPNYFVAVQISNDQIMQSLNLVQDHILQREKKLLTSMNSLKTLHITLMVMHIADQETYGRAMEALHNVHDEFDNDLSQNPLHLEFQGLSHFGNRVLYAKVSNDEATHRLTSLVDGVRKHFAAVSIFTTDSEERFTPHLTVAKIDYKKSHKGLKKIAPSLYEEFSNEYFGSQRVESIQLCRMTGPKDEAGYYFNEELFFTGFSPKGRLETLQKSLYLEEQKEDIKKRINKLFSEKTKC